MIDPFPDEQPPQFATAIDEKNGMNERIINGVRYRKIRGYSGYEVGEDGTVLSFLARGGRIGRIARTKTTSYRPCTMHKFSSGYYYVNLVGDDGSYKKKVVHRLVLEAFRGPCPPGMEGCHHPDPTRTNNRLDNLRWDTRQNNSLDRIKHGTLQTGERHPFAKLTDDQVREIRRLIDSGLSGPRIARKFGVHPGTIHSIRSGQSWSHLDAAS